MHTATTPLTVEPVALDRLKLDPKNPRRIADDQLDALTGSLSEFGLVQPIVVNRRDDLVIAGHQRLAAARRLGHPSVPVAWVDLAPAKARVLGLALNRIGGSFDELLLARLLAELRADPDVDLRLTGFDATDIERLLRKLEVQEKRDRPEIFDLDDALRDAAALLAATIPAVVSTRGHIRRPRSTLWAEAFFTSQT